MRTITSLPLCYSFSFDIETMTLFLKIQKWLVPDIKKFLSDNNLLMQYMQKTYAYSKEIYVDFGEKGKNFGSNQSIIWDSETDEEIVYKYTLTPVIEITEEICEKCNGTKMDFFSRPCHECRETGKKHIDSKDRFSTGMLSMYPIVRFLNMVLLDQCYNKDQSFKSGTDKKQMVAMEWSDTSGMHNCSMVGWVDDSVLDWVKIVPNEETKVIVSAMRKTEETLLLTKPPEYYFRFLMYGDNQFGFEIPGNACSLSTDSHGMGWFGGVGKTLTPHNVDHRFHQIEFIVGLAVMTGLIEKYNKELK